MAAPVSAGPVTADRLRSLLGAEAPHLQPTPRYATADPAHATACRGFYARCFAAMAHLRSTDGPVLLARAGRHTAVLDALRAPRVADALRAFGADHAAALVAADVSMDPINAALTRLARPVDPIPSRGVAAPPPAAPVQPPAVDREDLAVLDNVTHRLKHATDDPAKSPLLRALREREQAVKDFRRGNESFVKLSFVADRARAIAHLMSSPGVSVDEAAARVRAAAAAEPGTDSAEAPVPDADDGRGQHDARARHVERYRGDLPPKAARKWLRTEAGAEEAKQPPQPSSCGAVDPHLKVDNFDAMENVALRYAECVAAMRVARTAVDAKCPIRRCHRDWGALVATTFDEHGVAAHDAAEKKAASVRGRRGRDDGTVMENHVWAHTWDGIAACLVRCGFDETDGNADRCIVPAGVACTASEWLRACHAEQTASADPTLVAARAAARVRGTAPDAATPADAPKAGSVFRLVRNVQYRADQRVAGELDGLVLRQRIGATMLPPAANTKNNNSNTGGGALFPCDEALLALEVKKTAPDLVLAVAQRDRFAKIFANPAALPQRGVSVSVKGPDALTTPLLPPALFAGIAQGITQQWVFVTMRELPAQSMPLCSRVSHVVVYESAAALVACGWRPDMPLADAAARLTPEALDEMNRRLYAGWRKSVDPDGAMGRGARQLLADYVATEGTNVVFVPPLPDDDDGDA